MIRTIRLACTLFVLLALTTPTPLAASPEPQRQSTLEGAQAATEAAVLIKARTAAASEAATVAAAAEKSGAAAAGAGIAAESLDKVLADGASTREALVSAIEAASKAARAAAVVSGEALTAARKAESKVTTDQGRLKAGRAMDTGAAALSDTEKAATAAEKALAAAKAGANLDVVKTQGKLASTEASKAARAATEVTANVTEVAAQAAAPDLPLLTDADQDVLSALRVRMTGGAIFFNGKPELVRSTDATTGAASARVQSSQFNQAAMYLAVESQPRLWSFGGPGCAPSELSDCDRAKRLKLAARGFNSFYLDPFVNVRLTAIPVSTGSAIQAPGQEFLGTQKAAQAQFGSVFSWNFGGFEVNESQFHWGLGPTMRFMFQNVTDGDRAIRVWNVEDDLYESLTAGSRFTLYQRNGAVGEAPREGWAPTAYLDVSWGQFQNFESAKAKPDQAAAAACLQKPAECLAGPLPSKQDYDIETRNRWAIEARLMLRYVYLGLDINNGRGPDDMRFIGGLTVKLDNFMRRQ